MKTYMGYTIKPHKQNPASYVIVTEGGKGSIPANLEGLYTSTSVAVRAIDLSLENKEVANGSKSDKASKQSGV